MNCPQCGVDMLVGVFSLESKTGQILRAGHSEMTPEFTPKNGKSQSLWEYDEPLHAFRCADCDVTVIHGYRSKNTECLECGTNINSDETACRDCGWSFEK